MTYSISYEQIRLDSSLWYRILVSNLDTQSLHTSASLCYLHTKCILHVQSIPYNPFLTIYSLQSCPIYSCFCLSSLCSHNSTLSLFAYYIHTEDLKKWNTWVELWGCPHTIYLTTLNVIHCHIACPSSSWLTHAMSSRNHACHQCSFFSFFHQWSSLKLSDHLSKRRFTSMMVLQTHRHINKSCSSAVDRTPACYL